MSRFYVSKDSVRGDKIDISGKEAHHIIDVMRLKKLDRVVAFDGTGTEYIGFIKDIKQKSVVIEVVQTRKPVTAFNSKVTLIQAIPKKDKMDYIVEKSTELGVDSIIPILTDRTIVKWDERKRLANLERWKKIAREASKQCGRAGLPTIKEVRRFSDCLNDSSDYDLALIAALSGEAIKLKDALKGFKGGKIAITIGPEGDFTPREVASAKRALFKPVSLGGSVLKSDTAGLAALAILNYEFSN